jgi:hypothetical protein
MILETAVVSLSFAYSEFRVYEAAQTEIIRNQLNFILISVGFSDVV